MSEINWEAVGVLLTLALAFVGLNVSATRWLFKRFIDQIDRQITSLGRSLQGEINRTSDIERDLLRLRADLPTEYVRREDWIRFSNVIDTKLDSIYSRIEKLVDEVRNARSRS